MSAWVDALAGIEALEVAEFDPAVVRALEARFARLPGTAAREINFYVPTFKAYATSEIAGCGKSAWPAISITGPECKLQCDHCKAKLLAPMIPATTPDALWRVVNEQVAAGAQGMLLTGGSNHRDEVEYGPFFPTIRRIKDAFPRFRIAMHTALVTRDQARRIEESGIDAAMLDIIGAQDTVTQVYHLRRPVADFEASLAHLTGTSLKVVPHIVVGLHFGRLLGEWNALEMIRRHRPAAVVLVVIMPFYAPAKRPFAVPSGREVGRFFMDAREALPDIPVLLGCARPPGRAKVEIDAYAVMAGLNGIAHPSDGTVALAARLGRSVRVTPSCCSIGVGDEVLALDDGGGAVAIDVCEYLRRDGTRPRAPSGLAGIPVVSA
ncbi:MAG: radical SAM protein [Burkholderiales bacterium]|nr:radical SAM protein [Burkholderiales bacterium]